LTRDNAGNKDILQNIDEMYQITHQLFDSYRATGFDEDDHTAQMDAQG
jgi:hypothetical protein